MEHAATSPASDHCQAERAEQRQREADKTLELKQALTDVRRLDAELRKLRKVPCRIDLFMHLFIYLYS